MNDITLAKFKIDDVVFEIRSFRRQYSSDEEYLVIMPDINKTAISFSLINSNNTFDFTMLEKYRDILKRAISIYEKSKYLF